jgi:hypothetical protein
MTAVLEFRSVPDGGDDCRGGLRSNTFDRRDALATLAAAENRIDLLVEARDAAVEISEQIMQFSDCLPPAPAASVRSPDPTGSPEPTGGRG